jgi:FkbM family methyltransferase
MIFNRFTQNLMNNPTNTEINTELLNEIKRLHARLDSLALDKRLDRLSNDVEFVKNRTATYIGNGTALTYLIDETPIFVNSNDFGCPSNFINGGKYEEDYLAVLFSFCSTTSTFLDIGANLGVFSLRIASRLKAGKVLAFEPNPKIAELLKRSAFLAGYSHLITVCNFGLSNQNAEFYLHIPEGHAGGASITATNKVVNQKSETHRIEVKQLDNFLSKDIKVDLIKLDVEGHELNVLRGMDEILARDSDRLVIIFEKLGLDTGIETEISTIFNNHNIQIYLVNGRSLKKVSLDEFKTTSGYFLAASSNRVNNELDRDFLRIHATDLNVIVGDLNNGQIHAHQTAKLGEIVFYGPYWYLPKGVYQLSFEGELKTTLSMTIAERFGYSVAEQTITANKPIAIFTIDRDLTYFELVARAADSNIHFSLSSLKIMRIG